MKCPGCEAEGERSKVYAHGGVVTSMGWTPYWDEDGVYHSHDPNLRTSEFTCSRSHRWSEFYYHPCEAGDYARDRTVGEVELMPPPPASRGVGRQGLGLFCCRNCCT